MTELYFCKESMRGELLNELLRKRTGKEPRIYRDKNGKPYTEGVFFNLSHSGGLCVIALSCGNVGADLEVLRDRTHGAILSSLSPRERSEISCERDFLVHWTAREAYVKFKGGKLWEYIKRLEFYGGKLYLNGNPVKEDIAFYHTDNAVVALCAKDTQFTVVQQT